LLKGFTCRAGGLASARPTIALNAGARLEFGPVHLHLEGRLTRIARVGHRQCMVA